MSDFRGQQFPKGALYAAGGMIGITLVVVFGIRLGVLPARETAPQLRAENQVAVAVSRDFRFADRKDGALIATDAGTGDVALILEPGSNSGFIRGVMRGLMRERQLHEVSRDGAVTVTQWTNGALTLKDPSTGRILELGSFGNTNRAAFAQLLVPGQHVVESELKTAERAGPARPDDNTSVAPDAKPTAQVATGARPA
jgi:putative photosynthetic complex assembly protein